LNGWAAVLYHISDQAQTSNDAGPIEAIVDLLAGLLALHDPGILEYFQVMGDGRAADAKLAGDLADVHRTVFAKQQDDFHAHRVLDASQQTQRIFGVAEGSVQLALFGKRV
jgi:hypothetical protein